MKVNVPPSSNCGYQDAAPERKTPPSEIVPRVSFWPRAYSSPTCSSGWSIDAAIGDGDLVDARRERETVARGNVVAVAAVQRGERRGGLLDARRQPGVQQHDDLRAATAAGNVMRSRTARVCAAGSRRTSRSWWRSAAAPADPIARSGGAGTSLPRIRHENQAQSECGGREMPTGHEHLTILSAFPAAMAANHALKGMCRQFQARQNPLFPPLPKGDRGGFPFEILHRFAGHRLERRETTEVRSDRTPQRRTGRCDLVTPPRPVTAPSRR